MTDDGRQRPGAPPRQSLAGQRRTARAAGAARGKAASAARAVVKGAPGCAPGALSPGSAALFGVKLAEGDIAARTDDATGNGIAPGKGAGRRTGRTAEKRLFADRLAASGEQHGAERTGKEG